MQWRLLLRLILQAIGITILRWHHNLRTQNPCEHFLVAKLCCPHSTESVVSFESHGQIGPSCVNTTTCTKERCLIFISRHKHALFCQTYCQSQLTPLTLTLSPLIECVHFKFVLHYIIMCVLLVSRYRIPFKSANKHFFPLCSLHCNTNCLINLMIKFF